MRRCTLTLLGLLLLNGLWSCGEDTDSFDEQDQVSSDLSDNDTSTDSLEPDSSEPDMSEPDMSEADTSWPLIGVSSDFESGSIGTVQQISGSELVLGLRDDNDNSSLPDNWRSWWYVRLDDVPTDRAITVTISRQGWPFLLVPVYSFDQESWHRMAESEVSRPSSSTTRFTRQFTESTVWIAAFYPYTAGDLELYLDGITDSANVVLETIGETGEGRPLEMLTITDSTTEDAGKSRIWIHARSHPAETGSAFLLEGLIDFLLSDDPDAQSALTNFVFNIVPMHNVDGVFAGNYRTNTSSENLESMWFYDTTDPWILLDSSPQEVHALRDTIAGFLDGPDPLPITVALNLHSSNSEPDTSVFFYPHFGTEGSGYGAEEARLWDSQNAFISAVEDFYGPGLTEPPPAEGGSSFATANYPETWWWLNFGADVMAMTVETVYGRAGFTPEWVTEDDIRDLGEAVGLALLTYHDVSVSKRLRRVAPRVGPPVELLYPELYPPAAEDENKE